MYNANKPSVDELPSTSQLLRSTAIAFAVAIVILVTIVLPSEYGVDPTGIGGVFGLTEMGQIKEQLAREAEADRRLALAEAAESAPSAPLDPAPVDPVPATGPGIRSDEITITLAPGGSTEVKLAMKAGATVDFEWTTSGGGLNYDAHGDGGGQFISYEKGRGAEGDKGVLEAEFDGNHGWFWRNRTEGDVTVTLRTNGAYLELKRML